MRRRPVAPGLVDPRGAPLRDEAAHRRFRFNALSSAERVVWRFPDVAVDFKYRATTRAEASRLAAAEDEGFCQEVARLHRAYREDFMACLEAHEKRFNRGSMPEISIDPEGWRSSSGAIIVARMSFMAALGQTIIDTTEEADLLHPEKDVGRVVSLPGRKA